MAATFSVSLSPQDLDFELCLFCGQVFRFERREASFVGVDGDHTFNISPGGDGQWSIAADREAFDRLFRLDLRLDQLHRELTQAGPEMESIIAATPGLRMVRPSDAEEVFFCFLCSSNNHISRITSMIGKLAAHGKPLGEHHRFPPASVIAHIGEARLRELGFGYRAASISAAASRLARDPDLLGQLKRGTYQEAFKELVTFLGVGPKLADCICLFALDKTEAVPVDTHLWQAFCRTYRPEWREVSLTPNKMRWVGEFMRDRFGKRAGFAHHYLFVEKLRR